MKQFPGQFGNAPQYRDPSGTIPMPQPKDMPKAIWTQPKIPLEWQAGVPVPLGINPPRPWSAEGTLYRTTWGTPFFDMRPDLRSSTGNLKEGVPIWRRGARLYVQFTANASPVAAAAFSGLSSFTMPSFSAVLTDRYETENNEPGHLPIPQIPVNVGQNLMGPQNDLSTIFAPPFLGNGGGAMSMVGVFSPPGDDAGGGEGYPIRYWQARLDFSVFVREVPGASIGTRNPLTTVFNVQASVY